MDTQDTARPDWSSDINEVFAQAGTIPVQTDAIDAQRANCIAFLNELPRKIETLGPFARRIEQIGGQPIQVFALTRPSEEIVIDKDNSKVATRVIRFYFVSSQGIYAGTIQEPLRLKKNGFRDKGTWVTATDGHGEVQLEKNITSILRMLEEGNINSMIRMDENGDLIDMNLVSADDMISFTKNQARTDVQNYRDYLSFRLLPISNNQNSFDQFKEALKNSLHFASEQNASRRNETHRTAQAIAEAEARLKVKEEIAKNLYSGNSDS